ncbi:hypothetical protein [Hymenobacter crusticola]|uniref:Uncharacterized protein n=1 Tax=Hymenobacter crusticola TaxID=1770526 RepID=A0A2C9ZTP1_9BACT|nr:hypothetical protein [Hymenobacter crusticola]OUJ65226.1 hypothetical protein BXP70_29210 [Hymenobacter crusticola]
MPIRSTSSRSRALVVRPSLTLFEAKQQLLVIQAEEEALESLLKTPAIEITLRTGTEQMTITVAKTISFAVVHELLLDATQRRERAEQCYLELTRLQVSPVLVPLDLPQRA